MAELEAAAYTVPTDAPESDGTLAWQATTIVVVHAHGGGETGLGYTYGPPAVARLVADVLADVVRDADVLAPQCTWRAMRAALRNAGQPGAGALALSAVDLALHDLRARALGVPLARALGAFHDAVPAYGSGGFTAYDDAQLHDQLAGWAQEGFGRVKIKVGRDPGADPHRLEVAREAVGDGVGLMVDANGAFRAREAIDWARWYGEHGVVWFEEPVSSDDLAGLRRVRDTAPPGVDVTAGEYVWNVFDAQRMLAAESVDVLQVDVTRCGGLTELVRIDGVAKAHHVPLSAHCAPAVSCHAFCAVEDLMPLEFFHDHARVERMLFDGLPAVRDGMVAPDLGCPGNGLLLRAQDAERYRSD